MTRSFPMAAALVGLLLAAPVAAQTGSSGAAISGAISGNTIRGSMIASGGFEEYYAPDGQVRGPDYAGSWQVQDNRLCLSYDGDPPNCWAVQINGTTVLWIGAGGEEGTGTILTGNPRGY